MLITCPHCHQPHEINPASLLGKGKKKTPSAAATEQRRQAAKARWAKKKPPEEPAHE